MIQRFRLPAIQARLSELDARRREKPDIQKQRPLVSGRKTKVDELLRAQLIEKVDKPEMPHSLLTRQPLAGEDRQDD